MSAEVIKNNLPKLLQNINAMASKAVFVGIPHDNDKRNDGTETNAQIGFVMEFGSAHKNIPPRPFLRIGIKSANDKVIPILKEGAHDALYGKDIHIALNKCGLIGQTSVKNAIVNGSFAPLSKRTLQDRINRRKSGKAGTKPLIDTGQLLASITYVVK